MAFTFTYGTTGVSAFDPKVYLKEYSSGDTATFETTAAWTTELAKYQHIGECERDSITYTTEEDTSIEGNEVGKINLRDSGTVSFNIINVNDTNTAALEGIEGTAMTVMLVNQPAEAGATIRVFPNINFHFQETSNPGEPVRQVVSLTKMFREKTSFRLYGTIPSAT
mgnify:CR=1 FL=1